MYFFQETKHVNRVGGNVARITAVSQTIYAAMEKMTVVTILMRKGKTVQLVTQQETTSVPTNDVYQNDGCVILKMIVEMQVMKLLQCVVSFITVERST